MINSTEGMELLIDQMKETIAILKSKNKTLSDEKYRLFDEVTTLTDKVESMQHRIKDLESANHLAGKTLAEIKAQAIEDAANYLGTFITAPPSLYAGAIGTLLKYAESIRKGGE